MSLIPGHPIRERISDSLLRVGVEMSIDRRETARGIEAAPSTTPGYDTAVATMRLAAWVDSAILWLSWRVRPRSWTGR